MKRRDIVMLVLGAGAGFLAGWLVCKKTLAESILEELDAEQREYIDDLQERYDAKAVEAGLDPIFTRKVKDLDIEPQKRPGVISEQSYKKYNEEKAREGRRIVTQYNKPLPQSLLDKARAEESIKKALLEEDEGPDTVDEMLEENSALTDEGEREDPYEIDYEEFISGRPGYDKLDLYYYRFDDTLCDDNDEKFEEYEDIVGWDVFTTLEKRSVAYARNEVRGEDYEVHAISGSYSEEVAKKMETDRERMGRRAARKKALMDGENLDWQIVPEEDE